jgi:hypothetical protein
MTTKIVYYGPGLCGKTTNLNTIYGRTSQKARGEMVSLNTETDRTLFFDLLPMDVGMVAGFKTKLQLYTVPGQVFYNSTRKLVLKGVDGIVFVADSQLPMLDANRESLQNLRDNLRELGLDLKEIPLIFQWNKRDLKNIVPVEQLEREINPEGYASIQAIASDGTGVFETLRSITKLALANIKALHLADTGGARIAAAPRATIPQAPVASGAVASHAPSGDAGVPAEALSTMDLPSHRDMFGDEETSGGHPVLPNPLSTGKLALGGVQVMAPMRVKLAPGTGKGAPQVPKVNLKLPAPPPVKAPQVGPRSTQPSPVVGRAQADVQVDLPSALGEGNLEVVISVRQNGVEVGTTSLQQAVPLHGHARIFSIELKRP